VVGISVWEKKTVYSRMYLAPACGPFSNLSFAVDDGSAVIDCWVAHPPSPKKNGYIESAPKPIASLGGLVKVVGKVEHFHSTRKIAVTTICEFV
jgi:hypothetical protein